METDIVLDRLGRLERQNRALKRAVVLTLLGMLALSIVELGLPHAATAQTNGPLTASGFYVVDGQGRIRAGLAMDNAGAQPVLALYELPGTRPSGQQARALITLDESGAPNILLSPPGSNGTKGSIVLRANPSGTAMQMGGTDSSWGVIINTSSSDGSGAISVADGSGGAKWSTP